jgi:MFS family permease
MSSEVPRIQMTRQQPILREMNLRPIIIPGIVDAHLPSRAWLVVALLCVVGCLNYLDRVMLTTMRESLTQAIPMEDAEFGLLTSVFLWVYGALSPFAGFLADRISRSRVITGSLFLWSLTTWLTSQATTVDQLLATRALMGISEAAARLDLCFQFVRCHRSRVLPVIARHVA